MRVGFDSTKEQDMAKLNKFIDEALFKYQILCKGYKNKSFL